MSEATVGCEPRSLIRQCVRDVSARHGEFGDRASVTFDAPTWHRSATLPEWRLPQDLRAHADIHDKVVQDVPARVLLIDGGPSALAEHLCRSFPAPNYRVDVVRSGERGFGSIRNDSPDVIVLVLTVSDRCGLEAHRQICRTNPEIPVILIVDADRSDAAIEAVKQGAYDCLFRPLDISLLNRVVGEALELVALMRRSPTSQEAEADLRTEGTFVGGCPGMQKVYKAIGRVADQTFPVLITGESGTGKEVAARAIHAHGPRAAAPFLALNCAAIPEQLLESELFGHEKGAFTGADRCRVGKFEQCNGGTILLDEIGDMPLPLQAKILRLLQEQTFEHVGGNETIRTDVRLIAATHRDLKTCSAQGKFRADLYYRLSVFDIHLPPLRERGDDLPLLVQHYLGRFSQELGRNARQVAPAAMDCLRRYSWPGNIRELQSVLKQALLQSRGTVLLPTFLPEHFLDDSARSPEQSFGASAEPQFPGHTAGSIIPHGDFELAEAVTAPPIVAELRGEAFVLRQCLANDARDLYAVMHRQLDRLLLPRVLKYARGSKSQASLLLGIARQTFRLKFRELGLADPNGPDPEDDEPSSLVL